MREHLEHLLGGDFLCRYTHTGLHQDLLENHDGMRDRVESILEDLGRELRTTGEGEETTFYAAY
ncbi:hypothetical protein P8631_11820, partial [Guyparkeria sp. 1SP6A2]|nr:hypothetical protein [Guyparkeria sp. 1SP6A2]